MKTRQAIMSKDQLSQAIVAYIEEHGLFPDLGIITNLDVQIRIGVDGLVRAELTAEYAE